MQDLDFLDRGVQQIAKQRQKTLKQIQTNLLQARMLPVGDLLHQFPRMVRDLASRENKQVALELEGTGTLVDKAVLEKLHDPLVHLVRNAFDHGIEMPPEREALGKSPQGTITIRTYHCSNATYIEVEDDGRGIDLERIRSAAVGMNLISPKEAASMKVEQSYEYLFASGLSTKGEVSQLSGRGMGLSAVQLQVRALKGKVSVGSQQGKGTKFTLRLPLTLTILKLLIFSIRGRLLAIPLDSLVSIAIAGERQIENHQGQEFLRWQEEKLVPLYPDFLLCSYNYPHAGSNPIGEQQETDNIFMLLFAHEGKTIGLKIEQIVMEQDLVVKPFNEAIPAPSCLSGCTILGDGSLVPVLDSSALIEKWLQFSAEIVSAPVEKPSPLPTVPIILVVDDSLTIRQTLSLTLRKAGYRVMQARDGWDAIAQLRQESEIKAVICDIEMPRMNGLEFLSRSRQLCGDRLPVIMLTSRSGEKYRQLARQLGATNYLTKPYLDKELLEIIKNCLNSNPASGSHGQSPPNL